MWQGMIFAVSIYATVRLLQVPWQDRCVHPGLRLFATALLSAAGLVALGLLCLAMVQSLSLPVKHDSRMPDGLPGLSGTARDR